MKNWLIVLVVVATAVVQTGCSEEIREDSILAPSAIKTTFDTVTVRISDYHLVVALQSADQSLRNLKVISATASTSGGIEDLEPVDIQHNPDMPSEVKLVFHRVPPSPFSLHIVTKVNGHIMSVRSDYFGPHILSY